MIKKNRHHHLSTWLKLCLFPLTLLTGCGLINSTINKKFDTLTVKELADKLKKGDQIRIVDCRAENTFAESHIEGAVNIPISKFDDSFMSIPKDKPVALICYLGIFSRVGAQKLAENGYSEVYSVSGGMKAWESAHPDKP